jgi:hypothetical protein
MLQTHETDHKNAVLINDALAHLADLQDSYQLRNTDICNWLLALQNDFGNSNKSPAAIDELSKQYLSNLDQSAQRNVLRRLIQVFQQSISPGGEVEEVQYYKSLITNLLHMITEPWIKQSLSQAYKLPASAIGVVFRSGVIRNQIEISIDLPENYNEYVDIKTGKRRYHNLNREDLLIIPIGAALSFTGISMVASSHPSRGRHLEQTWTFGLL